MEYAEDDYLMISGIQHFRFCKRQWALIHIEQQWAENEHTVIGELMHKKAHDPYLKEKRKDTLIVRALPVSSRAIFRYIRSNTRRESRRSQRKTNYN